MTETDSRYKEIHDLISRTFDRKALAKFDRERPSVRLHECTYEAEEINAALDCLLSTYVTMGAKTLAAEAAWSDYTGVSDSIMVNSGSSANLLAVAALCNPMTPDRLKEGDEVIVPALCWSTTIWPLVQCGLVPVLVDIDPVTLNISLDALRKAISAKTRAVMLVHVYGNPCDLEAILNLCQERKLILIEDACEALAARYKNRHVGGLGRIGTFSTYYSHHITSLEGGFVVTNDPELAEVCRMLRAHGWVRELKRPEKYLEQYPNIDPRFLFVNSGYNIRPTELQAAFIKPQLQKLDGYVAQRRETAGWWNRHLAPELSKIAVIQEEQPDGMSSWFGYPIVLRQDARVTRQQFRAFLKERGIESRPLIGGNFANQPGVKLFKHRIGGSCTVSEHTMHNGLTWGNHQDVCARAREYIADTVKEFIASIR